MLSGRPLRSLHRIFSTTSYRRADPWPLPHTRQHMEATTIPPNIPKPIPVPRHNESLEILRARLTYQTRKRGTLESDLIMSTFAKEHLHSLTRDELLELDQVTHPRDGTYTFGSLNSPALIKSGHSSWTNQIGTCTIGVPMGSLLLSVGSIHRFSRSSRFTRAMRVRLSVACPTSPHHSALREWAQSLL